MTKDVVIQFKVLRNAYKKALARKTDLIVLEGVHIHTDYAKYLIQAIEAKGIEDEDEINLVQQKK